MKSLLKELEKEINVLHTALKNIQGACVVGLTEKEARMTITWVHETAKDALEAVSLLKDKEV